MSELGSTKIWLVQVSYTSELAKTCQIMNLRLDIFR